MISEKLRGGLGVVESTMSKFFSFGINSSSAALKVSDIKNLYREVRSFTDYLPWAEYQTEHEMMLLDDGVSVAAMWELEPVYTDARSNDYLEEVTNKISTVIGSVVPDHEQKPWVLSCYLSDDNSLDDELKLIKNNIHEKSKNNPLIKEYIKSTERLFNGMTSESGLFIDNLVTKQSFQGCKRKYRFVLYRPFDGKVPKGVDPVKELDNVTRRVESGFNEVGGTLTRMSGEKFYYWMLKWFNPNPAKTGGDLDKLCNFAPYPGDEEVSISGDYAASMMHSSPRSSNETNSWYFDEEPHTFVQVKRLAKVPKAGLVSGERQNGESMSALFDRMPERSVFVMHITFTASEKIKHKVQIVEARSQHGGSDAELTLEQAASVKKAIARGNHIFHTEIGVFVSAPNDEELRRRVESVDSSLTVAGLQSINPRDNLFPLESYLRNLPMVFSPQNDKRRKRSRMTFSSHASAILPIVGRAREPHQTSRKHRMLEYFNRGGEPMPCDPIADRSANGHMVIVGPSGTGKSASLNQAVVGAMAYHNAQIFILEAGKSFDPLTEMAEHQGLSVNKYVVDTGSNAKSFAPFFYAFKALDEYEDGLKKEENLKNGTKTTSSEGDIQDKNNEDRKEYLQELILLSRIIVTGGREKELDNLSMADESYLQRAILLGAKVARNDGAKMMRPTHFVAALRTMAKDENIPSEIRSKLYTFGEIAERYTHGYRGRVFNQDAEALGEADITHVEFGLAQRSGEEDTLALSYLAMINSIYDIAEKNQNSGRPIIVITDEAHLILKHKMIAAVAVKIVKMLRKVNCWYWPATQSLDDFSEETKPLLQSCEWLMMLAPDEIEMKAALNLYDVEGDFKTTFKQFMQSATKSPKQYTECVIYNKTTRKISLSRIIQPSYTLALAESDPDEKKNRALIAKEHGIKICGAALIVAAGIDLYRGILNKDEVANVISEVVKEYSIVPKIH